jgi:glycosyltransferase involved in cell wall biosynthesis
LTAFMIVHSDGNYPVETSTALDLNQVVVVIPVLNEEATIASIIQVLRSHGLAQIRVVDNGSSDHSANVAQAAGADVICEPIRGYGQACWRGIQKLPDTCEWLLFCDGDGSDDLSQLSEFFAAAVSADLILGNRRASIEGRQAMTVVQNFGNGLATGLMGLGWGFWYHDLGPLRMIRRSALEKIQMHDRGFGWTVEMQARAIEVGLNICEIPVSYRRRQGGRSKISGTLKGSLQAGSVILTTLGTLYLHHLQTRIRTQSSRLLWLSALLLVLGSVLIIPHGNFQQAGEVPHFWLGIGVMSAGFVLSWGVRSIDAIWFWSIAILTRLLLLPMEPSDDIWRYLWEGYIQTLGFSPYDHPPNAASLIAYRTEWWGLINHLDTSAIYPPVAQLGFRILAAISPSVVLFKLAFILADLVICWLLSLRWGYLQTLLYAWNPLIIYSIVGGGHYDSWFMLPLVAAWLSVDRNRWAWGAVWLGISAGVKWVSLPLVAFLVWRVNVKQGVITILLFALPILITALPFCQDGSCPLIPTRSGFVSSGRSAEWFPYFLSQVWPSAAEQNWVFALPLGLAIAGLLWRCRQFVQFAEGFFFALLTLSPIIHAWYFTWSVPFAVSTRNLGVRLVSLSSFIYFVLKHRQASGSHSWLLTFSERSWLWMPFILGFLWTLWISAVQGDKQQT